MLLRNGRSDRPVSLGLLLAPTRDKSHTHRHGILAVVADAYPSFLVRNSVMASSYDRGWRPAP